MNPNELSPAQALEILAQAAVSYRGTLEEHQSLQRAVQVIHAAITPEEVPAEEPKAKNKKKQLKTVDLYLILIYNLNIRQAKSQHLTSSRRNEEQRLTRCRQSQVITL